MMMLEHWMHWAKGQFTAFIHLFRKPDPMRASPRSSVPGPAATPPSSAAVTPPPVAAPVPPVAVRRRPVAGAVTPPPVANQCRR